MSKYNANGGQRRSSKTKIEIPGIPTIQCRLCNKIESRLSSSLKNWEMQHMHFSDGELKFMTCPQCKIISPMEMLKLVESDGRTK